MKLNQYQTYILPKTSIIDTLGAIPKKMEVKIEAREADFLYEDVCEDYEEQFFDDAIDKPWWNRERVDIEELKDELSEILPQSDFSDNNWKESFAKYDHEITLNYTEESVIMGFFFITDLEDASYDFLVKMLAFCNDHEWIIMDNFGNVSVPEAEEVFNVISSSPAGNLLPSKEEFIEALNR